MGGILLFLEHYKSRDVAMFFLHQCGLSEFALGSCIVSAYFLVVTFCCLDFSLLKNQHY